jgi:hypothetical protein
VAVPFAAHQGALASASPQPVSMTAHHLVRQAPPAVLQACGRPFGVPTEWRMGPTSTRCLERHCRKPFTTVQVNV